MTQHTDKQPWYRQFWPWFLIALPASAVLGSVITITLAVQHPHTMVVDDYSKIALSTERKRARDQRAASMGLEAIVTRQDRARGDTRFSVTLRGKSGKLEEPPASLRLTLSHPTVADWDLAGILQSAGDHYVGSLPQLTADRYYLLLEPEDRSWRLTGEIGPTSRAFELTSAESP